MSLVFKVIPKRVKHCNGQVLTPEMSLTVTLKHHDSNPFNNGAIEVKEAYIRMYDFDYKKACCSPADFIFKACD